MIRSPLDFVFARQTRRQSTARSNKAILHVEGMEDRVVPNATAIGVVGITQTATQVGLQNGGFGGTRIAALTQLATNAQTITAIQTTVNVNPVVNFGVIVVRV